MKNYNEIMDKVQETELSIKELRELVEALIEENTMLREQLGMSVNVVNDNLSLREAFDAVSADTSPFVGRYLIKTHNCYARAGFKNISEFEGKSLYDLAKIRNAGIRSCAIMIVILEHFGVKVEQLDSERTEHLKKISEDITKVRDSIVFTV